jgi:PAT family beta-lactamase induction signal transducer AmpG
LVDLMKRHRAVEILLFVVLYKIGDQLTQSLTRPFLVDMGYTAEHRGIALTTMSVASTIAGAFIGGFVTTMAGLGHSLWIFGLLQILSNGGYALLAVLNAPHLGAMYAVTSFEMFAAGLGMGAFGVLLMRLTEKRFSATQYALLSSLFALPRVIAGPITGFAVNAIGWPAFFFLTMLLGIPGLVMLARFVPLGVREPAIATESTKTI